MYHDIVHVRLTVLLEEPITSSKAPAAIEKVKNLYQSCLNTSEYNLKSVWIKIKLNLLIILQDYRYKYTLYASQCKMPAIRFLARYYQATSFDEN